MDFFSNISITMRDRGYISIKDIKEIISGLSFGVLTFDLHQRSKGQTDFFSNIEKIMRDRDSISIVDI